MWLRPTLGESVRVDDDPERHPTGRRESGNSDASNSTELLYCGKNGTMTREHFGARVKASENHNVYVQNKRESWRRGPGGSVRTWEASSGATERLLSKVGEGERERSPWRVRNCRAQAGSRPNRFSLVFEEGRDPLIDR